ncbi:hypothetical protein GSH19_01345 [Lactobacillus sp. S2-2]|uniref:hypothetical protein n=1 Tax=Lactobacillus sp. S2-2 TaxID=2692917 RepID=UPI001F42CAFA|nr:hypothetical protein [Lactobacillus sp. S2-2]MCF6514826.1 hypothetical protein [Lactobacillus sp. S2-2]
MSNAIFLVTSIESVNKNKFRTELKEAINNGIKVKVIIAMIESVDSNYAFELIKDYLKKERIEELIEIVQLSDIFASQKGIKLNNGIKNFPDLNSMTIVSNSEMIDTYIDENGEIVAEKVSLTKSTKSKSYKLNIYSNNSLIQTIDYGSNDQVMGIQKFENEIPLENLLFNNNGELVFRFIAKKIKERNLYSLSKTSIINPPKTSFEVDKKEKGNLGNKDYIDTSDDKFAYEIIDYINYQRINGLYEFYALLINNNVNDETRIYIDLNDNILLANYLSNRVIFNY